ncbi:MAG TPA: hypothetical protein VJ891_20905, partial [Casimicrobiaceae bacterium]|nr:hypothetical protein [Casimicrobiaceae bacterium]
RENVGWRTGAARETFDFRAARVRAECATEVGVQIVWTLFRGSWPDDIDVVSDHVVESFRAFAEAAARNLCEAGNDEAPVYTPIDEISFTSWALAETSLFGPNRTELRGRADEIRRRLVRAAIAGCDAILEVAPDARFVHREAALTTATFDAPLRGDAQFASWDMLTGRLEPELGGHPRYLDAADIHWHGGEPSRGIRGDAHETSPAPHWRGALSRLIHEVHARYRCPVAVSETNRASAGRTHWLHELGEAIGDAIEQGDAVIGASLCRIVERPAWEDPRYWRARRLWDALLAQDEGPHAANSAYEQALSALRARIDPLLTDSQRRRQVRS